MFTTQANSEVLSAKNTQIAVVLTQSEEELAQVKAEASVREEAHKVEMESLHSKVMSQVPML